MAAHQYITSALRGLDPNAPAAGQVPPSKTDVTTVGHAAEAAPSVRSCELGFAAFLLRAEPGAAAGRRPGIIRLILSRSGCQP
jgi:hypothetical protein